MNTKIIFLRSLSILLLVAFLFGGQAAAPARAADHVCVAWHTYTPGETLEQIASRYGIEEEDLLAANPNLKSLDTYDSLDICLPYGPFEVLYPKATLYAKVFMGRLTLQASGIPAKYRFVVKVSPKRWDSFTRLGTVRASEKGVILKYYRLPKSLWETRYLRVCLKEQDHGWLFCTRAQIVKTHN